MTTNKAISQTYSEENLSELPKLSNKRKIQALTILKSLLSYSFSLCFALEIVIPLKASAKAPALCDLPPLPRGEYYTIFDSSGQTITRITTGPVDDEIKDIATPDNRYTEFTRVYSIFPEVPGKERSISDGYIDLRGVQRYCVRPTSSDADSPARQNSQPRQQ